MGLTYKSDVLAALIADHVAALGRGGQTRMARALGVEVQTVNKWVHGQTHPTPDRWPAIEHFLGLPAGEIAARVIPRDGGTTTADEVRTLRAEVDELSQRLQGVESALRRALKQASR